MAWAHVQSTSLRVASGANAKAYTSSITAGSLLVAAVALETDTATVSSLSDNVNGAWTAVGSLQSLSGFAASRVYYLKNAAAGATTVTLTPSAGASVLAIHEYSGLDTTAPFDATVAAQGTSTSAASGSQSLAVTGELVFGLIYSNRSVTVGSGYTNRVNDGSNNVLFTEDKVGASSDNVTGTLGSSGFWLAHLAAFREPFSASPPSRGLTLMGIG